ncbi:MAG: xanthan lyase [Bacteroidaceae bacterium]|nr:xanthan lyase [Bacteroidaceae bacterium]
MLRLTRALAVVIAALLSVGSVATAQTNSSQVRTLLRNQFQKYQSDVNIRPIRVEKVDISTRNRTVDIYFNQPFSYQLFRRELNDSIYRFVREALPNELKRYDIKVHANNYDIEQMIPNWTRKEINRENLWNDIRYDGSPWKRNESLPYSPVSGLSGIHMAVTPSHGYYYDQGDTLWEWQRPPLYCTHEDLLTQSFAYPFLIPMLENAGAVVYTARERDWQHRSVTVKATLSDDFRTDGRWSTSIGGGYLPDSLRICPDDNNVATLTATSGGGPGTVMSTAMWIPDIPEDGDYAVYVTYQSDPTRVDDARYIVFHSGGTTTFHVNQRMGGGTWLYLGTFRFKAGQTPQGMVTLDNSSSRRGTVNADAVRFGGGMARETRQGLDVEIERYNIGSKYYTRFAGAPDSIHSKYKGTDDYREDIWTRPYMMNWISGGSVFNTANPGLGVPIELNFALHTDAGYRYGDSIVGSIGICTTDFNKGVLGDGHDRIVSRDLADMVLDGLTRDIKAGTGREWGIRGVWDRNYCESREPQVLSMLLELLSHQNYWDMKLALNSNFRFMASRSIYKSLLRYVSFMHDRPYVVQPLPVEHLQLTGTAERLQLQWHAVADTLEPTAIPEGYIVYTAIDDNGFDNGVPVKENSFSMTPEKGHLYRFKVTAVNKGGESLPSETLAAGFVAGSKGTVLVVNGFQRLGGPAAVENDSTLGFDIMVDPGVQYMKSPILCGAQYIFDRKAIAYDEEISLGISDDRYNGRLLAGNTFDYPEIHGRAIMEAGWSFVSCSREPVQDGSVELEDYMVVDLILGLQKRSLVDTLFHKDYSTFPTSLQRRIEEYLYNGGYLLASGSYVGADMISTLSDESFTSNCLYYRWEGALPDPVSQDIKGLKNNFLIQREADEYMYGVTRPDVISPVNNGQELFYYSDSGLCAGVGYKGRDHRCVTLGFPFESITKPKEQSRVMASILKYLTN